MHTPTHRPFLALGATAAAFSAGLGVASPAMAAIEDGQIILIRACVVESDTGVFPNQNNPNAAGHNATPGTLISHHAVNNILGLVNDIWAQAQIGWLILAAEGQARVPVIADPDPSVGLLGDVVNPAFGVGEPGLLAEACDTAWQALGEDEGLIFVVARDVLGPALGLTGPDNLSPNDPALCSFPRSLTAADLPEFVVVSDAAVLDASDDLGHVSAQVWAHEFGHALLLGHGDGLDQAPFGAPVGEVGPRLYDRACDQTESASGASLMSNNVNNNTVLTPLQIETARDAAAVAGGCSVGHAAGPGAPATLVMMLGVVGWGRRRRGT